MKEESSTGTVAVCHLTEEQLVKVLRALPSPAEVFLLREEVQRYQLTQSVNDFLAEGLPPRGRAFSPEREIRWEVRPALPNQEGAVNQYKVILLTEKKPAPLGPEVPFTQCESNFSTRRAHVLLWGTYRDPPGYFIESRIPRPLHYPSADLWQNQDEALVETVEYLRQGCVQYVRWCEVKRYA